MNNSKFNLNNKYINTTAFLIFLIAIIYFIYNIYIRLPIVHPELVLTFPKLLNHPGEGFIEGLYKKTFNLQIVEFGGYRPRLLAFLIGYIEPNLIVAVNDYFPDWGIRQPFQYLGFGLLIFVGQKTIQILFPLIPLSSRLLTASSVLFFFNIQTSLYYFHGRSAKVLAFAACLYLINHFLMNKTTYLSFKKNLPYYLLSSLGLFLLATLDEAFLALLALLAAISLVISASERRINNAATTYILTLIIYFIFYVSIGRFLFEFFTPTPLREHTHTIFV